MSRNLLLTTLCLLSALLATGAPYPESDRIPDFSDEFSSWDNSKWINGNPYAPSKYSEANVQVSNGKLKLKASGSGSSSKGGYVKSKSTLKYGYFEFRAKPLKAKFVSGLYLYKWTAAKEYSLYAQQFFGTSSGKTRTVYSDGPNSIPGMNYNAGRTLTSSYNTYGVDWQPGKIKYYFNGALKATKYHNSGDLNQFTPFMFTTQYSSWAGNPTSSELSGQAMEIDWVHVYRNDYTQFTSSYPPPTPPPTPSPPATPTPSGGGGGVGSLVTSMSDEFSSSYISSSKWQTYNPYYPGPPDSHYKSSNTKFESGKAKLSSTYSNGKFNGAFLRNTKWIRYGTFELRAKIMPVKNYISAFWMYAYRKGAAAQDGTFEIDWFEIFGKGTGSNKFNMNVHYYLGNPDYENDSNRQSAHAHVYRSSRISAAWHTFKFEWTPTHLKYYIDGSIVAQRSNPQMHWPMRYIFTTEVHKHWTGGMPSPSDMPDVFQVDYIRVRRNAWTTVYNTKAEVYAATTHGFQLQAANTTEANSGSAADGGDDEPYAYFSRDPDQFTQNTSTLQYLQTPPPTTPPAAAGFEWDGGEGIAVIVGCSCFVVALMAVTAKLRHSQRKVGELEHLIAEYVGEDVEGGNEVLVRRMTQINGKAPLAKQEE